MVGFLEFGQREHVRALVADRRFPSPLGILS